MANLEIYWYIIKFNAQTVLVYPFDLISWVIQRVVPIGFVILLWSVILNYENQVGRSIDELISYYILGAGISIFTMARYGKFGKELQETIKTGSLNQYLLHPVSTLGNIYARTVGISIVPYIMGSGFIIVGLIILKVELINLILFLIFLTTSSILAFGVNILEAGLPALLFDDFKGVRNVTNHVSALLSGLMVPLYLFPQDIQNILGITPFPVLIYYPIQSLSINEVNNEVIQMLFVSLFWSITFLILSIYLWKKAIRKYEAIGI